MRISDWSSDVCSSDLDGAPAPRRPGLGSNVLTGRENRLAELAAGSVVSRTHELVDPARCRMWAGHNREYALLNEERCADIHTSRKAKGRQDMLAIARRMPLGRATWGERGCQTGSSSLVAGSMKTTNTKENEKINK